MHPFLYELEGAETGKSFSVPCGVATDSYGDIYVASHGNGTIDVFNPAGKALTRIEGLNAPCSLAVDTLGNVYADEELGDGTSRNKVVLYKPDAYPPIKGTKYQVVKTVVEGEFGRNVKSIAIDPAAGHVDHLIVDEAKQILEFKSAAEGSELINDKIGEGLLEFSYGVDVEAASGDIYVALSGGVKVLDPEGKEVLREVPAPPAPGLGTLQNIALDQGGGNLLIFVKEQGALKEFGNPAGKEIPSAQIGPGFGAAKDSLKGFFTVDVAVDSGAFSPNKGNVYIVSGFASKARLYAYGPLKEPRPEVVTGSATEATETSARLNGSVDPNGLELKDCHFDYVTEANFKASEFAGAAEEPCEESPAAIGEGKEPVPVHAHLSSLPAGAYRFRLVAANENPPPANGLPGAFGPPEISEPAALPVSYTEATARAKINPEGLVTAYKVEYGTDESYGQSSPALELEPGIEPESVAVSLSGLQPGTKYHYRFLATNAVTSSSSSDLTFTTLPEPPLESCPNSSHRTGFSANLPDCRAYELVTPPQMYGKPPSWFPSDPPSSGFITALATTDGESVIFQTHGTLPGTEGNGIYDGHRAVREPNGWSDSVFSPSSTESAATSPGGVSPDHLYSFWNVHWGNGTLAPGEGEPDAHYVRIPGGVANPNCSPDPQGDFELVGCGDEGSDPTALGRWITAGAAHLIFTSRAKLEPAAALAPSEDGTVYDRSPGGPTDVLSLLPGDLTPPSGSAIFYRGASADATAVAFQVGTTLYVRRNNAATLKVAEGGPTFAGFSNDGSRLFYSLGGTLNAFDTDSGINTPIASGGGAAFVNVSTDGSHAYFTSTEAFTGPEKNEGGEVAKTGADNLYLWEAETKALTFVAVLAHSDVTEFEGEKTINLRQWATAVSPNQARIGPANDPSRTTPDGDVLVFQSHAPLTGYKKANGHSEVFRYDATNESLACVSCSLSEAPANSDANLQSLGNTGSGAGGPLVSSLVSLPNASEDGHTVFFQSADALAPADVNGVQDVYEWRDGRLSLISSGQDPYPSFLYAMSADGSNVFFSTREALVSQDEANGGASIYDARENGGFPPPSGAKSCEGEACQGGSGYPPIPSSLLSPPPSLTLHGPGNESRHPRPCPRGTHRARHHGKAHCTKRHRHRKHGRASANRRAAR